MAKQIGKTNSEIKHTFNYLKNNEFSTHFVTGIIGGISPQFMINMDLFVDRPVIPRRSFIKIDPTQNKVVSHEVIEESLAGTVREVFCGLLMTVETAKSINEWLTEKIAQIEEQQTKMTKP